MNDDELKHLWKSQATPGTSFAVEQLRASAKRYQRRIAWRNALEYAACVYVIITFAQYIVQFPFPLLRAGSGLIILGTLVVAWQLHARASSKAPPGPTAEQSSVDFHQAQLLRQRDALRSVWLWYAGPFIPGLIVFRWGVETELGAGAPFARGLWANLSIAAAFLAVIALNRFFAHKLQRRAEVLQAQVADQTG